MNILTWMGLWIGYAWLAFNGDLRDSPVLEDEWNPQVWWAVWFVVLLFFSVMHWKTGKRKPWGTGELSILLCIAILRSVIYFAAGFEGPFGVWLIVATLAARGWILSGQRRVRSPDNQCARAHFCQLAVDMETGERKNPHGEGQR